MDRQAPRIDPLGELAALEAKLYENVRELADVARLGRVRGERQRISLPANDYRAKTHCLAARLYCDRLQRQKFFCPEALSEGGWNLLLELFVVRRERRQICVKSACIAAGGAPTTALRILSILERAGLVERIPDKEDRRRCFVRLTDSGCDSMESYLEGLLRKSKPLP